MVDNEIYELKNGIRLIHKEVSNTKIVHCGFVLDIGSRDESDVQAGSAHFWEHMVFKGTTKRKAYHILSSLDALGGELNAYTTKEKICFHASILDKYFQKAFEVLSDIAFNSTFPEKQLENERGVILEEMAMYESVYEDAIQDEFDELIFPNHALGRNILGNKKTVKSLKKEDLLTFIRENLDTSKLVFSSIGGIPAKKAFKLGEKFLSEIQNKTILRQRSAPKLYTSTSKLITKKDSSQAYCVMGSRVPGLESDEKMGLFILNNILGGPALNSRLNLGIREKYGYVYSIESSYVPFVDTGMLSIYFSSESAHREKVMGLIKKELRILRDKPLGTMQLHKAKVQLTGQLAMAEENNMNIMLSFAKSLLDLNKIDSLETVMKEIDKISAFQLQEIAQSYFGEDRLSSLIYDRER